MLYFYRFTLSLSRPPLSLYIYNIYKIVYIQRYIFTLYGSALKLMENITYLVSSVSSTENDINMRQAVHALASRILMSFLICYGSQIYPIK